MGEALCLPPMKIALFVVLLDLLALVGFTYWALESDGVAVVETAKADGSVRSTHVWFATTDGALWLEAGKPENGWFQDVQREPHLWLTRDGQRERFLAEPLPNPEGHERVRAMLREKYGLRDRWIAFLFDTSRSVAVRLVPAPE